MFLVSRLVCFEEKFEGKHAFISPLGDTRGQRESGHNGK
jgi:hypothetical protein